MLFDFGTNRVVQDLNVVPEQFRPLYTATDTGGFALSNDPQVVGAVEAILGMQKALTASRAEAKEAKGKAVDLSALSEWGTDTTTISAAFKQKIEEMTSQVAKGKGADLDLTKLKEAMGQAHAKELQAKDSVIASQEAQLHRELVTNRATGAILSAKGNPLLLMPHLNKSVKTVANEKGEYEVHVVDDSGARRFSGVTGEHMTIEELVSEMKSKEDFGVCFTSDAPVGGGARPPSGIPPRVQPASMSATEKIAAGLAKRK